jgi:predicted enzyme related to lactoylglutathione lyase
MISASCFSFVSAIGLVKTWGDQMKLGYTLFYVDDVAQTMDFYARAFGLEKGMFHDNDYGEMVTGETKLGFVAHQLAESHGFEYERAQRAKKPSAFEIAFVTDDVEAAYAKAVKAGALALSAPKAKPWGQLVSYVRDCNGFLVEICSPVSF